MIILILQARLDGLKKKRLGHDYICHAIECIYIENAIMNPGTCNKSANAKNYCRSSSL